MRRRIGAILVTGAVLLASVATAPARVGAMSHRASAQMVFRMATFEPDSLDPTGGGSGYQEYQNLFEPLVDAFAPGGKITPLAAQSYTISPDGLTYTFILRPGLRWSDGKPVTMRDYRYAWLRQLDPATAAYSPDDFYAIKNAEAYNLKKITGPNLVGIKAPNDRTLVVTLAQPAPYFLRLVGGPTYFPVRQDIIAKYGNTWTAPGHFVGNGPYMLQEWKHNQTLVLVPNPYYNGIWKGTRHVTRIEYTLMQDPWDDAVAPYQAHELDVAVVPSNDLAMVRSNAQLKGQIHRLPISGTVELVFDARNKPTSDVRVRQALAMAIDYNALANEVLHGAYAPARSFSPPDLASYNPSTFAGTNVQRAKQLLAAAGYPNGAGFPPFTLTHWSQPRESLIAQALQAMWQQNLGISVSLQSLDPKAMTQWREARATTPYNAYLALNWSGFSDPEQFHNAQLDPASNVRYTGYDNPAYVRLISAAVGEVNPARRAAMYKQAEAIINRDVPIVSLIDEARLWLVRPYVHNFATLTTPVAEMLRVAAPPGLVVDR